MYLSEFQLYNYKSYQDSGPIQLKPGFNLLTGQNNAGKTALLEGLSLQFTNKPHRSLTTLPHARSTVQHASRVRLRVPFSENQLVEILKGRQDYTHFISPQTSDVAMQSEEDVGPSVLSLLLSQQELPLELHGQDNRPPIVPPRFAFGLYKVNTNQSPWLQLGLNSDNKLYMGSAGFTSYSTDYHFGGVLRDYLLSSIYIFRAERMNVGVSPFGPNRELKSDASNLPEVLNILQSNPSRFQRYNQLVKRVLPQVERITVRPMGEKQVEILVWSYDPALEREDLAVALMESGTGISQVLAMLYVLVTAEFPRILIIDEPNSFLHPGAVRALVEIFREHPQHQYIISTHSPDLISACNPSTLHILRKKEGATVVEKVDARETRHLRALLLEVGSRLSDVFGSDNVLWVEGKTEEICFPLIVQKQLKRPLSGVSIVGVLHTGDFDSEDPRSAFRLYEKLTQGQALLPPAIAFIFDRELRPEKARQDLIRQSQGKVSFLKRRTYENYLLHARSLSSLLNGQPGFEDKPTTPEQIQTWLDEHASDAKYYLKAKTRVFLEDVDAPRLLGDLFAALSSNTLEYNKVEHSLALTEWLLEHDPAQLQEIADLLSAKLFAVTSAPKA